MPARRISIVERLLRYRRVDAVTGCWEWTRYRNKKGYGSVWRDGHFERVPRVSYEIFVGPIPEGLLILHRCDNPPCFNPDHLFPGTQAINIQDSVKKGRWHSKPKLTCKRGHHKPNKGACPKCVKEFQLKYYRDNRKRLLEYASKRDRRKVQA